LKFIKKGLCFFFVIFFISSHGQDKPKEKLLYLEIIKDDYTKNWIDSILHMNFRDEIAFVPTNSMSIEPDYFEDSCEFRY
jgi:hypothetical protein